MHNRCLTLCLCLILSACSSQLKQSPTEVVTTTDSAASGLRLQYLGVGGHLLSYDGQQVLTAPSFTNPHWLFSGPFMPLSADIEKIDKYMPPATDADMLLVGHGHYDHLLDVPHIAQTQAPNSVIYGSQTTVNTLAAVLPAERLVAMNQRMGTTDHPGEWLYNRDQRIRIMAIESGHAPHIAGIKFMSGRHEEALEQLPWHAFGWKEGQTLAFLIDFLDENQQVKLRLYYQDAASEAPLGLLPPLEDGKRVDVAILCPASFAQLENYPEAIVQSTQARYYVLGHWEDFFANDLDGEQRFVRLTDQDEFIQRLERVMSADSEWILPGLFSTYHFEPES